MLSSDRFLQTLIPLLWPKREDYKMPKHNFIKCIRHSHWSCHFLCIVCIVIHIIQRIRTYILFLFMYRSSIFDSLLTDDCYRRVLTRTTWYNEQSNHIKVLACAVKLVHSFRVHSEVECQHYINYVRVQNLRFKISPKKYIQDTSPTIFNRRYPKIKYISINKGIYINIIH